MGSGEDYIDRFGDWLDAFSSEERTKYRTLFPELVTWKSWWDDKDKIDVLEHGNFWADAWRPKGQPKYAHQWPQQEFSMGRKRELYLFRGYQSVKGGRPTKSCLNRWQVEDF